MKQDLLKRIEALEKQLAELKQLAEVKDVNINFSDICNESVTCRLGDALTAHKDALITYECWEANTGLLTGQLVIDTHGVKYGYDLDRDTVKKIGLPTDKQYKVTQEGGYVLFDEIG